MLAAYLSECFFGLLFYPEDGGSMFFRNVGNLVLDYTPSHTRNNTFILTVVLDFVPKIMFTEEANVYNYQFISYSAASALSKAVKREEILVSELVSFNCAFSFLLKCL
jgi:hypothetical protein